MPTSPTPSATPVAAAKRNSNAPGGRLDVYGVLRDGAGTSSRLVKSGTLTLNLTGDFSRQRPQQLHRRHHCQRWCDQDGKNWRVFHASPGDVTVNGTGSLQMNIGGGEQIANSASSHSITRAGWIWAASRRRCKPFRAERQREHRAWHGGTLIVAPSATGTYNSGVGVSDFAGSISGSGTVRMNGTGTYGMLGANSDGEPDRQFRHAQGQRQQRHRAGDRQHGRHLAGQGHHRRCRDRRQRRRRSAPASVPERRLSPPG